MKISQIIQETSTTAGSVAPVEHGFVKMQTRNPGVYGDSKVGNLLKGKKTNKAFANSVNESAEISETDLSEQDLIVVPGQGRSVKTGFVPHDKDRTDHEVEMAVSDLFSAGKNAEKIYNIVRSVSEEEGLEGWVQEKIIKANDYLNTVREYLEGKQVQGVAEGYDPVESDYQQWEDILVKDGYRGDPSGAYALKLVVGHQGSDSDWVSAIRNILAYVKQNRKALGKAVSDSKTVKDAIIDIKREYPQLYQAAQQQQGVAEGSGEPSWYKNRLTKPVWSYRTPRGSKIVVYKKPGGYGASMIKPNGEEQSIDYVDIGGRALGSTFGSVENAVYQIYNSLKRTPSNMRVDVPDDFVAKGYVQQGVAEGADNVDSLVKATEAVMKKFKIDATQIDATQALKALKIVLGEREYNDRPGYYNSFIRQIIARSKQQGVVEGEGKLDELSPHALGSYVKSAAGDMANRKGNTQFQKGARVATSAFTSKQQPGRFEKDSKIEKRQDGINRAVNKITGKN